MYLPQILNKIIEEPKAFKISREYDCQLYHISIALDQTAFGTIVSLYWIQSNFIEHIIYREIDQSILSIERIEYPNSQFIDGFVTIHSQKYSKYDFVFAVLSHEKSDFSANYTVHIFDIDKDKIYWIDKFTIETLNNKLRKYNPLIPIFATNVMILVHESEKALYVVSENPKFKNYVLRTTKKIMHVYPVFDDQLYISHYNDTEVSVYKLYYYQEDSSRIKISIELIRIQNFTQSYFGFDIDTQGKVLVFSKPNIILVYQIKTINVISYLKRLNFFKYMKEFTYTTNDYENGIVYNFYDNFLYIIMVNMTDPTDKALFIFDYIANSHNWLKTVLKIDKKYYKDSVSIYTELFNIGSTIYSYLFFEGKEFQLIKFESDNVLIPSKYSSYLFLPKDFAKYSKFEKSNVSLSIFPLIIDREFSTMYY